MHMRRIAAGMAVGVLLASGLAAGTASADPQCHEGKVCFYRGGSLIAIRDPQSPFVCSSGGFAGTWDMVRNYSSVSQWSYEGEGCIHGPSLIRPRETRSGLGSDYSYSGG